MFYTDTRNMQRYSDPLGAKPLSNAGRTYGYAGTIGYAQVNEGRTLGVDVRVDLF